MFHRDTAGPRLLLGILLSVEDPRMLTAGQVEVGAGAGAGAEQVKSESHVLLCPP